MNEPLYYAKPVSFEKRQVFKCWKYSGVKVWQSYFKEIIELITFIITRLDNKR